jgi:3'-5' exoribonuclease
MTATTTEGAMPHVAIRDFQPNAYVNGTYALVNPQMGTTRAGKPFFKALIRDASGEAAIRVWTFEESSMPEVTRTGFVFVSGQTQHYNGQVQLIAETIRGVDVEQKDLARLLPVTKKDIGGMMDEVASMLRSMRHPGMLALAEAYLGSTQLMDRFRAAPAAVSVHHAYIGGLLEHTLQLMKLADHMLPLYPALNRDLVLMGLFLHDLGKTAELEWEKGFSYTTDGNLVGHVVRGAVWLQAMSAKAAAERGGALPPEALRVLMHMIISHHGELEHGAAKVPSTPEAMFVAMLDNLDAKVATSLVAAAREKGDSHEPGHEFSDKVWALDVRVYRPDPLAPTPAAAAPARRPEAG